MKSGYDQFFKQVRKNANDGAIKVQPSSKPRASKVSQSEVAQQLRERVMTRTQMKRKKKASIPWKFVGFSFIGLVLAIVGMQYSPQLDAFIKRVEFSVMGIASAEEKSAPPAEAKKAANEDKPEAKTTGPTPAKEYTQEELNHFAKLNDRKKELDAREEELARLESELQVQKSELDKKLEELKKTRREISSVLDEKVKADEKKVDALVQMYSNMKPQQAAKIFETMDDDLAIEILGRMKKKPAAEILNLVKAEKAQVLSEKYAGYRKK